MRVKFSDVDEFLDELRLDRESIAGGILRVTRRFRPHSTLPLQHLELVATCVIRGQIVAFEKYLGELMQPSTAHDDALLVYARKIQDQLVTEAGKLGLSIRAGLLEG